MVGTCVPVYNENRCFINCMSPCDIKSTRLVKRLVQYDGECQTELIAPKSQTSNLASYVEQHKVQFLSDIIRAVNW